MAPDKRKDPELLTVAQAAEDFGVTTQRIYQLIDNRAFPTRRVGRTILIHRTDWRKFRKEAKT